MIAAERHRAPVSVVVPTLNVAGSLGPCLEALATGLSVGLIRELVFADGGSSDGIEALADAAGAKLVATRPGRGTQLASGADAATGDWLLILHADTILDDGWVGEAWRHIATNPGKAGYFRLGYEEGGMGPRIVSFWANCRAQWLGLPYGDQGLLVPRSLYLSSGGYPDVPIMEDVAIVRRIGRDRLRMLGTRAITDFSRYRREGWFFRGARNLFCLATYFLGVSPERIAAIYRGSGRA